MKLKVCGMKYNISEVAACQPEYLGFIFYEKSPRNFIGHIPELPSTIQKVGVFVNAPIEEVVSKTRSHSLANIQLHGDESERYCKELRKQLPSTVVELWKVFPVGDTFNFMVLQPYENVVDKFLFDTSGPQKGGNGVTFNWNLLNSYPSEKQFILSGGIGLEEIPSIKKIANSTLPLFAIDVNSRFEDAPGMKNIHQLKQLLEELR